MMRVEKGSRVGAIMSADEHNVKFFGYGIYEGDEVPDEIPEMPPNPKIKLDSGKVVWGYECWWGPEEQIKKVVGARTVVVVDPDEQERGADA